MFKINKNNENMSEDTDKDISVNLYTNSEIIKPPKLTKRPGGPIETEGQAEFVNIYKQNENLKNENYEMQNIIINLKKQIESLSEDIRNIQIINGNQQAQGTSGTVICNVETSNSFENIQVQNSNIEEDYNDDDFIPVLREQNKTKYNRNKNKENNNKSINKKNNKLPVNNGICKETNKKERIPPINIYTQTPNQTEKVLVTNNIKNFTIQRINNNKHVLFLKTADEYNTTKAVLNDVNTQYYTYTLKSQKPKNVILKGLSNDENTTELLNELKEHESETLKFISCSQFQTKASKNMKTKLAIYVVQVSPETLLNTIQKIKYIRHQKINWEKIRSRDITQCKNCQRYGHGAINCKLQYRCVKCRNEHLPGECLLQNNEKSVAYCTNCEENGHPASYRGCPKYQKLMKKMQEAKINREITSKQKRSFHSSYIKEGINYADLFQSKQTENQNIRENQIRQDNKNDGNINEKILQKLNLFQTYMIETDKKIETLFNAINSIMNG